MVDDLQLVRWSQRCYCPWRDWRDGLLQLDIRYPSGTTSTHPNLVLIPDLSQDGTPMHSDTPSRLRIYLDMQTLTLCQIRH